MLLQLTPNLVACYLFYNAIANDKYLICWGDLAAAWCDAIQGELEGFDFRGVGWGGSWIELVVGEVELAAAVLGAVLGAAVGHYIPNFLAQYWCLLRGAKNGFAAVPPPAVVPMKVVF